MYGTTRTVMCIRSPDSISTLTCDTAKCWAVVCVAPKGATAIDGLQVKFHGCLFCDKQTLGALIEQNVSLNT